MINLVEGLKKGDLSDLLLPMISFNEFESKIDDTALVIGFYLLTKEAAEDLNIFIQKSYVPILDSEVSSSPTKEGFYIVFVELMITEKIEDDIINLIYEIDHLTGQNLWTLKLAHLKPYPLTKNNINIALRITT